MRREREEKEAASRKENRLEEDRRRGEQEVQGKRGARRKARGKLTLAVLVGLSVVVLPVMPLIDVRVAGAGGAVVLASPACLLLFPPNIRLPSPFSRAGKSIMLSPAGTRGGAGGETGLNATDNFRVFLGRSIASPMSPLSLLTVNMLTANAILGGGEEGERR
jgi:hypothetical protein